MPIANVIHQGNIITVYDEKNHRLWGRCINDGPNNGCLGYTSSQVNIRDGNIITSFDAKGHRISGRCV